MVIIIKKYGQLGNRLFPFAHFIAHSSRYQYKIYNLSFEDYAEFFSGIENVYFVGFPKKSKIDVPKVFSKEIRKLIFVLVEVFVDQCVRFKFLESRFHQIIPYTTEYYHPSINNFNAIVKKKKIVFICNQFYFRDYETLWMYKHEINDFLKINSIHANTCQKLISQVKNGADIIIGVHIRGKDFRTWMDGKYFFDIDVYIEAMKKSEALFSEKVSFLLCSDENRENINFEEMNVHFCTGHIVEDMYCLSMCNYLIGGYSSYLYWASFYGDVPLFSVLDKDIFQYSLSLNDFKTIQEYGTFP